jgi:hypothetical protein
LSEARPPPGTDRIEDVEERQRRQHEAGNEQKDVDRQQLKTAQPGRSASSGPP